MELLYNPDRMPESEIKETFVAREQLVDDLVELIKSQPDGAGVQHAVIIAPRGMGKTTVLLMVKFAAKDRGLAGQWQAVKFPEESYGIYDLADLWVQTLELIASDTGDTELRRLTDDLKIKYPKNDELQEAAYAAIRDWRRKHGKRLLLLVENFDQILEQINDERDNARLRDALMNDDAVMFLSSATNFFKEARAYDQPLYNFFRIYDLANLRFEQMQELLRRRAKVDRIEDFQTKLKQNASRLRALEYFTGGNPRLVLMLYRVVSHSDVTEVRRALEKLLDEVTPYYKAKVEALPAQQRKILDHIARVSGETSEGLTPGEIAAAVRLSPNQVSAQLKRLSEIGYVRASNLRVRSSWYTLSEPLYAIWHQMRFGRSARERMRWLIGILKALYTPEEMKAESSRLERRFRYHVRANHSHKARDVLEHHRYLMEAMVDAPSRLQALERIIHGHLRLKDAATVKTELLSGISPSDLSDALLNKLIKAGCLSQEQVVDTKAIRTKPISVSSDKEYAEIMEAMLVAAEEEEYTEILCHLERLLKIRPEDSFYWSLRGCALLELEKANEAITCFDQALKFEADDAVTWLIRGQALAEIDRYEDAITSYDKVLEIDPDKPEAWFSRGSAFYHLKRYEEALEDIDRGLEIKANDHAWFTRGCALVHLHRYEEAVTSFDHVPGLNIDTDPGNYRFEVIRGVAHLNSGRYQEALLSCDKVLKVESNYADAWHYRGVALYGLDRYEEALANHDRALEIDPDDGDAWRTRGLVLGELGRGEDAVASFDRALEIDPNDSEAWFNRGNVLDELGRYEEAVASFDRALEINPDFSGAWFNRGLAFLQWLTGLAQQGKLDEAKQKWNEALASGNKSNDEDWPDEIVKVLLEIAKVGKLAFARQLIAEAGMEERLFPLARAIDYLQTGDEALIEKLSPEVRGIVEEVVAKLKETSHSGS